MVKKHRKYTEEQIEYIRSIAPGKHNVEIAEMFNAKFNLDKTASAINAMKGNHKIVSGKLPKRKNYSTRLFNQEQEQFIKDNVRGLYNEEIAELVNKEFGLTVTPMQINTWKANNKVTSGLTGHFEKGQESWNKGMKGLNTGGEAGWFKKGQEPINYRPVGSERICTKDGYILIKVSDYGERKDMWKLKHVIVWEKNKGKIPEGYAVVFLNSERTDVRIENLELITRGELARMNQLDLFSTDPEVTKSGIHLMRLNNRIYDLNLHGGNEAEFERGLEISERNGIHSETYKARLKRGWNLHDAMNKPLNHTPRRVI